MICEMKSAETATPLRQWTEPRLSDGSVTVASWRHSRAINNTAQVVLQHRNATGQMVARPWGQVQWTRSATLRSAFALSWPGGMIKINVPSFFIELVN